MSIIFLNINNNAEVRSADTRSQSLTQEKNVTILGINHFSKVAELYAIHRILGFTGFMAATHGVRTVIQES